MSPGLGPEKGHFTPEVKMANKIACVWDKLYPPNTYTISVTCSKWYIRRVPFVLGAQPLDWSPLCHPISLSLSEPSYNTTWASPISVLFL
jgi:hypothetical protein